MRNKTIKIPKPTSEQVKKYLKKWQDTPDLVESEKALKNLFEQTYPKNNKLEEILIKVSALDSLYGTNLRFYSLSKMARHIKALKIDNFLIAANTDIVNKISSATRNINFYSFSAKYCSFHQPNKYPKYDSNVNKALKYFQCADNFYGNDLADVRNYKIYKEIIDKFKLSYRLDKYSYSEIDHYLYQLGKEYFTK